MFEGLSKKISEVVRSVSGKANISENNIREAIEEIKIALLEADVNFRVVRRFVNRTTEEALGEKVLRTVAPGQQFVKIVHDRMVQLLGDQKQDLKLKGPDTQSVILLLGLQGTGKTTTAAKLARFLRKKGRNPLLIAADFIRPAAVEQLKVLGEQAGIPVYTETGKKSSDVVKNGIRHAKKEQFDTVIVDTTGRLQIDEAMMNEIRMLKKAAEPEEILLVADAMTGQNAVDIAKSFNEQLDLTGIILSKFDSDTRGGAALSIKEITGKPIKFIGTGEKLDDLEPFYPDRIASRILGMGDVVSLVEKAQESIRMEDALELQRKIEEKTFDLEDYLDQIQRVRKMGSLRGLIDMIPGMKDQVSDDRINEAEVKQSEAIIQSMTRKERKNYRIIGTSRRKRIASGSGTSVYMVNRLLKQFEKARTMMKKMTNKKFQSDMMSKFGNLS